MFRLATKFRPESEAFERARAAGFRGAELWLSMEVLADWRNVLATARTFPFYYALHSPNEPYCDASAVEQLALLYSELECTALVLHQVPFALYGDRLSARVPGMRVAVENHVLDRAAFTDWAQRSPGLALDVEHLWKYTLDNSPLGELAAFLRGFLQRFGDKLHHVHLPGYRPGCAEHCPLYFSPELAREVMSALTDCGYAGLVVSEADPPYQQATHLRRDVALYREWFEQYSPPSPPAWQNAPPVSVTAMLPSEPDAIQPASALTRSLPLEGSAMRLQSVAAPPTLLG